MSRIFGQKERGEDSRIQLDDLDAVLKRRIALSYRKPPSFTQEFRAIIYISS